MLCWITQNFVNLKPKDGARKIIAAREVNANKGNDNASVYISLYQINRYSKERLLLTIIGQ